MTFTRSIMRHSAALGAFLALAPLSAGAATLTSHGITYDLTVTGGSLNSTSATFNIHITGINGATDDEGGRSGINDFALSTAGLPTILSGSSSFGAFQTGGLNSSGCNGSGAFFCFNGPLPPSSPALAANSSGDLSFTVNLVSGNFLNWDPDFKIDWVGSKNNYDLVSLGIDINSCTNCAPPPGTPIPGALPLFASGMGLLGYVGWRRKRRLALQAA